MSTTASSYTFITITQPKKTTDVLDLLHETGKPANLRGKIIATTTEGSYIRFGTGKSPYRIHTIVLSSAPTLAFVFAAYHGLAGDHNSSAKVLGNYGNSGAPTQQYITNFKRVYIDQYVEDRGGAGGMAVVRSWPQVMERETLWRVLRGEEVVVLLPLPREPVVPVLKASSSCVVASQARGRKKKGYRCLVNPVEKREDGDDLRRLF